MKTRLTVGAGIRDEDPESPTDLYWNRLLSVGFNHFVEYRQLQIADMLAGGYTRIVSVCAYRNCLPATN